MKACGRSLPFAASAQDQSGLRPAPISTQVVCKHTLQRNKEATAALVCIVLRSQGMTGPLATLQAAQAATSMWRTSRPSPLWAASEAAS